MKQLKILFCLMAMVFLSSNAFAYVIDGDLSDWGVNLASAFSGTNSSWIPAKSTVDYTIEDNIDPANTGCDWTGYCARGFHTSPEPRVQGYLHPAGGEHYDIEAMYFDDDSQYGYFAVVTSIGPNGYTDQWGRFVKSGDLAIDVDNNPLTGEYGYEYAIKLTGPNIGQVCYLPNWDVPTDFSSSTPSTFTCDNASNIKGTASVAYVNAGVPDNGVDNYVIEVRVPRNLIGNPTKSQLSSLHSTLTCGNDVIEIDNYDWNYDVPEFTALGAGLALLGISGYLWKKRK